MKIYLRKITDYDLRKEINTTGDVISLIFNENYENNQATIKMCTKNSDVIGDVVIKKTYNGDKDWRFNGIKPLLRAEKGTNFEENDIFIIYKNPSSSNAKYIIEYINPNNGNSSLYDLIDDLGNIMLLILKIIKIFYMRI